MTGKWVYPKRTDGVYAVRYDGSKETAQEICGALDAFGKISINPEMHVGDTGGELYIIGGLTPIKVGQYVIIRQNGENSGELIEVIDYTVYHQKYNEQ